MAVRWLLWEVAWLAALLMVTYVTDRMEKRWTSTRDWARLRTLLAASALCLGLAAALGWAAWSNSWGWRWGEGVAAGKSWLEGDVDVGHAGLGESLEELYAYGGLGPALVFSTLEALRAIAAVALASHVESAAAAGPENLAGKAAARGGDIWAGEGEDEGSVDGLERSRRPQAAAVGHQAEDYDSLRHRGLSDVSMGVSDAGDFAFVTPSWDISGDQE